MNRKLISGVFILVLATGASTNAWSKGEGKGGGARSDHPQGQMGREQNSDSKYRKEEKEKVREHRDDDDAKERREEHEERREREEKAYREHRKDSDKPAGLAKQREKKSAQEQKELGRGSEQGQKAREENSRKWWQLWGE